MEVCYIQKARGHTKHCVTPGEKATSRVLALQSLFLLKHNFEGLPGGFGQQANMAIYF